jgi:type II secretion system protein G
MKRGFTLIELLVVIAVIGVLSAVVLPALNSARNKSYLARAKAEFTSIRNALEMYYDEHNAYPPDASRDVAPPGVEQYLGGGWPKGPWPGSYYDWDNWVDPDNPGQRIYQISIRFCPSGGTLAQCRFPKESWAQLFDINSAVYYCISGACRPHQSEAATYPGYCVNC